MYGIIYRAFMNDGRSYVGQTIKTLNRRIIEHRHHSKYPLTYFHNALKKYGFEEFKWEILEECQNKKELDLAEQKWIIEFNSIKNGFNLKEGGSYGAHSEETKQKIREGKLGENNPMYGKESWNKNKLLTKEHCKNLSKSHIGQIPWNKGLEKELNPLTGRTQTEEIKQKISKANSAENNGMAKLNWEKVRQIRNLYQQNNINQYQLAKLFNISQSVICEILNNKRWIE